MEARDELLAELTLVLRSKASGLVTVDSIGSGYLVKNIVKVGANKGGKWLSSRTALSFGAPAGAVTTSRVSSTTLYTGVEDVPAPV